MKKEEALTKLINAGYEAKEAEMQVNEAYTASDGVETVFDIIVSNLVKAQKESGGIRTYGLNENGNLVDS